MKRIRTLLAGICLLATGGTPLPARAAPVGPVPVDLVICLDTSGSMEYLLDSARSRLWDVVTELSKATPRPVLRVACLTYGTPEGTTQEQGWVIRQTDLTSDLDSVYSRLMALSTLGGDEYVGCVLHEAIASLNWSHDPRALKLIFVAGNESADQGAELHSVADAAAMANARGIVVNAIYAGEVEQGTAENWPRVAESAGGVYAAIDVALATRQVATPFDEELQRLNEELNRTYLPYGPQGDAGLSNQREQDANALRMGLESCGSRIAAKGCGLYLNAKWDLIDAIAQPDFDLSALAPDQLPPSLRRMSVQEQRATIAGYQAVRAALQGRIAAVSEQRQVFLRQAREQSDREGFDEALIRSLHLQAAAKGFLFPKNVPTVASAPSSGSDNGGPLIDGQEAVETVRLKPPLEENLAALMAALPATWFGSGDYWTPQREFAEVLVQRAGHPLRFRVAERTYDTSTAAAHATLAGLRDTFTQLQRVEEIPRSTSPFVYRDQHANRTDPQVGYRIGGIDFPTRDIADTVKGRVDAAVHRARLATPVLRATLHIDGGNAAELDVHISEWRALIERIAQEAAMAYMQYVDGC